MTSQKSLNNTFLYTFKKTFSDSFIFPLITFISMALLQPITNIIGFSKSKNELIAGAIERGETAQKITDIYKYKFGGYELGASSFLAYFIVIILSIGFAVFLFKFIADKRTVNVYYSLGITRRKLFFSKYLAGTIMLFVATVIPSLAIIFVNVAELGSSSELWFAGLYRCAGFFLVSMAAFTFTAFVFSCVGTIAEGLAFSTILILLPTIVFSSLNLFVSKWIWGSPYSASIIRGTTELAKTNILQKASAANPILFAFYSFIKYDSAVITKTTENNQTITTVYDTSNTVWSRPDFKPLVLWAVIIIAIALLTCYIFQKRKSEICGFRGKNKVLNTLVTFTIAFAGFALAASLVTKLSKPVAMIIAVVLYFIVYFVLEAVFNRSKKEYAKGLIKAPIHAAVILIISTFVLTNFFGLANNIPKLENIEKIEISTVNSQKILGYATNYYGSNSISDGFVVENMDYSNYAEVSGNYTSESDKQFIIDFNKEILKLGKKQLSSDEKENNKIAIIYTLKNGKEVRRVFNYSTNEINQLLLGLENTDYYKQKITENLTKEFKVFSENEENELSGKIATEEEKEALLKQMFTYEGGVVQLSTVDFTSHTNFCTSYKMPEKPEGSGEETASKALNLYGEEDFYLDYLDTMTKEQHTALKKALLDDLLKQTTDQKFRANTQALGIIRFIDKSNIANLESNDYTNSSGCFIYITPDMENTLKFLKDNDMMKYIEKEIKPVKAYVRSAKIDVSNNSDYYMFNFGFANMDYEFTSRYVSAEEYKQNQERNKNKNNYEVDLNYLNLGRYSEMTDAQTVKELYEKSNSYCYRGKGGCYCVFELSDGSYISTYVFDNNIPQSVRAYL
ncbi:MAG: hypothetical protein K5917_07720 [Clostridiales bacterium]|nr:hypothetical protein [Clostridiales bacterium]